MFQKKLQKKISTHVNFNKFFFVYEIMWKNIVSREQTIVWRMRILYWLPKTTNTHSEYVGLIAFPLQQCLHERASVFRHIYSTYIACLVPDYFMSSNSQSNRGSIWCVSVCLSNYKTDRETFLTENWYSNMLPDNSGVIIRALSTVMANV